MRVDLTGQIERITYTNPENGYTIAQVKVRGEKRVVSVVGNLIDPMPGEMVELQGQWKIHPKYGEQFDVEEYRTTVPATIHGIKKYLGSGLIKGIGPVMAGRIVAQFGKKTLDIIENNIEKLSEIDGIGGKRIEMIQTAWEEQKEIRTVMMFLQSHQVSTGYATKIFKQYGDRSITVVTENPFQMATDIFGIGFITADKIAANIGFSKDSPLRIRAGILYVLNELSSDGHVYYPYTKLIEKCSEILEVAGNLIGAELTQVAAEKQTVIEDDALSETHDDTRAVYLARSYFCETGISYMLKRLMATPKTTRPVDADQAVKWVQEQLDFSLADNQKKAILSAIQSKFMVITGGPGTGKTTIIQAVLKIYQKLHVRILLAAPTGRAAKQMSETTGFAAKTIHRMLSFNFRSGGFQKNEKDPLDCDLLIVDEASMIDTVLMHHLLKAVPQQATLILVGDVNQLPSVGAGNILGDIIASHVIPVVRLNEIFRQAQESRIIVNAHRINNGFLPKTDIENDEKTDFYFIDQESPERVLEIILELAANRIPKKFGFDAIDDIQVLSPMHKGLVGTANLNKELQKRLNPGKDNLVYGSTTFHCHDKVMQIRNNYDKNVFNGDIGRVVDINRETREVIITFDDRKIAYDFTELDEVVPAYAVSVHKSQGSEYPAVIIPVLTQHYILLQRNLIYTAITRGRRLVILVGTKKALAIAINNDKTRQRFTRLKDRLQGKAYVRIID
ncbi:MAG: ATP-dependent RecD-like DNA helicase [Desulfobacteraceae bacterium]|nr:ATP-dependent RecD-like DNA helicase [Desulfobacteraceae bacterium]